MFIHCHCFGIAITLLSKSMLLLEVRLCYYLVCRSSSVGLSKFPKMTGSFTSMLPSELSFNTKIQRSLLHCREQKKLYMKERIMIKKWQVFNFPKINLSHFSNFYCGKSKETQHLVTRMPSDSFSQNILPRASTALDQNCGLTDVQTDKRYTKYVE